MKDRLAIGNEKKSYLKRPVNFQFFYLLCTSQESNLYYPDNQDFCQVKANIAGFFFQETVDLQTFF